MTDTPRSRLLAAGLLALGVTPAALLAAAVMHLGFCHADPHSHGEAEPVCCEVIESAAHGHHHTGADAEHAHPATMQRNAAVVPAVVLPASPVPLVSAAEGPLAGPARLSRDPPSAPLFLATQALLL